MTIIMLSFNPNIVPRINKLFPFIKKYIIQSIKDLIYNFNTNPAFWILNQRSWWKEHYRKMRFSHGSHNKIKTIIAMHHQTLFILIISLLHSEYACKIIISIKYFWFIAEVITSVLYLEAILFSCKLSLTNTYTRFIMILQSQELYKKLSCLYYSKQVLINLQLSIQKAN